MSKHPLATSAPSAISSSTQTSSGPFIIGVCGGTASGKTTVCQRIIKQLGVDNQRVAIISLDCFYKSLPEEVIKKVGQYNFDHPDAFDWDLVEKTFKDLIDGKPTRIPVYDFVTHSRRPESESTTILGIDIVLFEGILAFYQPKVRNYMNMREKYLLKIDVPDEIVLRDITERGRDIEGVLNQYEKFVKPSYEDYILPTKKYADVIIPHGAENLVAIDLIVQHIKSKLYEKKKLNDSFETQEK